MIRKVGNNWWFLIAKGLESKSGCLVDTKSTMYGCHKTQRFTKEASNGKVDAHWPVCMVLIQHTVRIKSWSSQIKSDRTNCLDGLKIQEETGNRRDLQNRRKTLFRHTAQEQACLVMVNLSKADFNPKIHVNKLHLNDKGSYKVCNVLVNYVSSIYKWYDINEPFVNINSNDIKWNISDVCRDCVSKTGYLCEIQI